MVSFGLVLGSAALAVTSVSGDAAANGWNWGEMTQTYSYNGEDNWGSGAKQPFTYFDGNYMMALLGTNGEDQPVLHQSHQLPKIGLTSMEKVTSMTAVSTRASIRSQLVGLLKSQVRIESMYGTKKEKLYLSASTIYNFIARLLHSACQIALSNDVLWKEQMQCFSAYRQLLEIYSMWNAVRDVSFALEHGMSVTPQTLAVCGPNVADSERFVAQDPNSNRLQSQYLVSATMRACFDNLQVRIEALRRWLSTLLVSMDSQQDRAQSCLFRVITVLTCLSSGNQENVLDLAIKEEHKQHVVFSLARYSSIALNDAHNKESLMQLNSLNATAPEGSSSFVQMDSQVEQPQLREVRRAGSA